MSDVTPKEIDLIIQKVKGGDGESIAPKGRFTCLDVNDDGGRVQWGNHHVLVWVNDRFITVWRAGFTSTPSRDDLNEVVWSFWPGYDKTELLLVSHQFVPNGPVVAFHLLYKPKFTDKELQASVGSISTGKLIV